MKTTICIFVFLSILNAQSRLTENTLKYDSTSAQVKYNFNDFAFLSGEWTGEAFGGNVEEYWSEPSDDVMLGIFKLSEKDTTVFTEFFQLKSINGILQLRLKHFSNNFIGWEEKEDFVIFQFIKLESNKAYFNGLTYERKDQNNLVIYLAMHNGKNAEVNEIVFNLKRKNMDTNEMLLKEDRAFAKLSLEKGAAEAFKEFLADDAKQFSTGSLPIVGNESIYNGMKPYNYSHVLQWEPQEAEVSASGDMGFSWGYYKSFSKEKPNEVKEGKYVNIWKKLNGKWKVVVDIGNSN